MKFFLNLMCIYFLANLNGASNYKIVGNVAKRRNISLRHYFVLIFNFSDIEDGCKIKISELHHKSSVKI